jgi:hypothetical protein
VSEDDGVSITTDVVEAEISVEGVIEGGAGPVECVAPRPRPRPFAGCDEAIAMKAQSKRYFSNGKKHPSLQLRTGFFFNENFCHQFVLFLLIISHRLLYQ